MIILIFISMFVAAPFLAGLYYLSTGIARKHRSTAIAGFVLVAAWCVLMYFIYSDLYAVFAKGE
jgi:hypothetical protein